MKGNLLNIKRQIETFRSTSTTILQKVCVFLSFISILLANYLFYLIFLFLLLVCLFCYCSCCCCYLFLLLFLSVLLFLTSFPFPKRVIIRSKRAEEYKRSTTSDGVCFMMGHWVFFVLLVLISLCIYVTTFCFHSFLSVLFLRFASTYLPILILNFYICVKETFSTWNMKMLLIPWNWCPNQTSYLFIY